MISICIRTEFLRVLALGLAGSLKVLAFAPYDVWGLVIVSYVALFYVVARSKSVVHTACYGLIFFSAAQLSGHHWMLHALSVEVGWPDTYAVTALLLLALYLALPASFGLAALHAFHRYLTQRVAWVVWLGVAPWVIMVGEFARSWAFGGFSSLYLGYVALDTPLAGAFPIGSVWLAGWALLMTAYTCYLWIEQREVAPLALKLAASLAAIVVLGGCLFGAQRQWVQADGSPVRVSVLQTDVPQEDKFKEQKMTVLWAQLKQLTQEANGHLWVAPETVMPVLLAEVPGDVHQAIAQRLGVIGARGYFGAPVEQQGVTYNAVVEFDAGGPTGRAHFKAALMPFGEYLPWGFGWMSPLLDIPLKDLSPGPAGSLVQFSTSGAHIAFLVCHEDLDPELARRAAAQGGLLLNPTNLAWFDGLAGQQRLQISRVRAAEVARPLLRSANRDGSAVIDHRGRVLTQAPAGAHVLHHQVQPTVGETWFSQAGLLRVFLYVAAVQVAITFAYRFVGRTPNEREGQERPE
jgi:apolipoprotein N-acyltransferase